MFEGERAYETAQGPAIFRHHDHLERLFKSAELYYMPIPYTLEELRAATHELIAANGLRACYIRPIVYRGYGQIGPVPARRAGRGVDRGLAVGLVPRRESKEHGVRVKVSSWRRIPRRRADPARQGVRPVPQQRAGEDRGVQGRLSGGDPARLARLRVRGLGREHLRGPRRPDPHARRRPPASSTGSTASRSCGSPRDLGYEIVERDIARAELFLAEEVFFTGTAAELVPVREIDDHVIGGGQAGPITREIQRVYEDALHGRDPRYLDWIDVVKVPTKTA